MPCFFWIWLKKTRLFSWLTTQRADIQKWNSEIFRSGCFMLPRTLAWYDLFDPPSYKTFITFTSINNEQPRRLLYIESPVPTEHPIANFRCKSGEYLIGNLIQNPIKAESKLEIRYGVFLSDQITQYWSCFPFETGISIGTDRNVFE